MIEVLAKVVVFLAACYFVLLGVVALTKPAHGKRFLLGFAGSPFKHYAEMLVRLLVGGAFISHSTKMGHSVMFLGFGWLLVATTVPLMLVPWRLHRQFTEKTVPLATRYMGAIGLSSFVAGVFTLYSMTIGAA